MADPRQPDERDRDADADDDSRQRQIGHLHHLRFGDAIRGQFGGGHRGQLGGAVLDARKDEHSPDDRSEEHTSELQSLMRISYAVFCLKKKKTDNKTETNKTTTCKHNTNRMQQTVVKR